MKAHEIKSRLIAVTGRDEHHVHHGNHCFEVFVRGDEPHEVAPVRERLAAAGIPFRVKPKGKAFAGAHFIVPVRNVGSAFNADWVLA